MERSYRRGIQDPKMQVIRPQERLSKSNGLGRRRSRKKDENNKYLSLSDRYSKSSTVCFSIQKCIGSYPRGAQKPSQEHQQSLRVSGVQSTMMREHTMRPESKNGTKMYGYFKRDISEEKQVQYCDRFSGRGRMEEYLAATTDPKVEKVGSSTGSFQRSPATKNNLR